MERVKVYEEFKRERKKKGRKERLAQRSVRRAAPKGFTRALSFTFKK